MSARAGCWPGYRSSVCSIPEPSLDDGTALWTDYDGKTNQPSIVVHQGVRLFITPTPLGTCSSGHASAPGYACRPPTSRPDERVDALRERPAGHLR